MVLARELRQYASLTLDCCYEAHARYTGCLKLTKAMQKTSETLQIVADIYDDHVCSHLFRGVDPADVVMRWGLSGTENTARYTRDAQERRASIRIICSECFSIYAHTTIIAHRIPGRAIASY